MIAGIHISHEIFPIDMLPASKEGSPLRTMDDPCLIFDSRVFCRKIGSHCNRVVAMENQHALREDTRKRNACALDFGDPKEKICGNDAVCWEF